MVGAVTKSRFIRAIVTLALLLAASVIVASAAGYQPVSWSEFRNDEAVRFVFLSLRLPRIVMAGLIGSTLALTGAALQALFRNPLADPFVLGVSGGSAFGLASVWGVMQYLEERGVGFPVGVTVVPLVAGAIIFDLGVGDHRARPDRAMGYAAAAAALPGPVTEGNVGAGTGATVGKLHGHARAMRGGPAAENSS